MDYLEIMNLCGFDLDKAHEMAKQRGTEDFSESLKKMHGSTRQEQEGEDVHIVAVPTVGATMVITMAKAIGEATTAVVVTPVMMRSRNT